VCVKRRFDSGLDLVSTDFAMEGIAVNEAVSGV
jgi:hypothetical protein